MKKIGGMWDIEFCSLGHVSFLVFVRYPGGGNKLAFGYMLMESGKKFRLSFWKPRV